MTHTVFFSWQADHSSRVCKNLIEWALEKAIKKITVDLDVVEAIRDEGLAVDKDTLGIPGSPPIVETILRKIDEAAIFLPDLTFVGKRVNGTATPNPNVLIEYGWALKSHGHTRMIAVMNDAFGEPNERDMPFDLRHLRHPIRYTCAEDADVETRNLAREQLSNSLASALKAILTAEDLVRRFNRVIEKEKFIPAVALDGPARFRALGDPIGIQSGNFQLANNMEIFVKSGPASWLRCFPEFKQNRSWTYSELQKAKTASDKFLQPIGAGFSNFDYVRGPDGAGNVAIFRDNSCPAVAYVFETGEVWSINTYHIGEHRDAPNQIFYNEEDFSIALRQYVSFLKELGVDGPLIWEAGLTGIKNKFFRYSTSNGWVATGPCLLDTVFIRGLVIDEEGVTATLKPFFEEVLNRFGL